MSRVRSAHNNRQTAAAYENERGGGCLSFYALTPLSVLAIGILISLVVPHSLGQATNLAANNSSLTNRLAPLFTPEVQYWNAAILRWSDTSSLDPNLIATIMQIESCGNVFARSSAGALGLFQVMPSHFSSSDNPFDPDTNALRGLTYLSDVFHTSNRDIQSSLAAYNGGPGLIGLDASAWPAETIRYVYWGSGIYADAAQMKTTSPRLNEWLIAGGASLCRQSHQQLNLP